MYIYRMCVSEGVEGGGERESEKLCAHTPAHRPLRFFTLQLCVAL